MPHRCMNCGEEYEDGDDELIEGCACGSNLFLYKQDVEDRDEEELRAEKRSVMEELDKFVSDVKNRIGGSEANIEFDMESIRVADDGVYEINLKKLLDEAPLIVEIKDGSYRVHLASVFSKGKDKDLRTQDLDLDDLDVEDLPEQTQ